jgi:hypothetical protein
MGCGGGSGVDRSKALAEMTPGDSLAICESAARALSEADAVKVACYIGAVFASAFDPSIQCEPTAQACIANPEDIETTSCEPLSQDQIDALPACAAQVTLGEYEDCQVASARALANLADEISCTADLSGLDEMPAACQTIAAKCPELFGGTSGSGVDRAKPLSSVTLDEATTVCNYAMLELDPADALKFACYVGAIFESELDPQVNCNTAAQECIAAAEPVDIDCDITSQADIDGLPACAAQVTLGEYEDCQVATARAMTTLAAEISCSSDLETLSQKPAECQAMLAKCPGLFTDGSGVDPDKAMSTLTPAEANAICEAKNQALVIEDYIKVSCYVSAFFASQSQAECEDNALACIASPPPVDTTCNVSQAQLDALPACAAQITAGQYEACVVGRAELATHNATVVDCVEGVFNLETPDECFDISISCPEFFDVL